MDGSGIFVSHSSKDNAFVTQLVKDLRRVLGNKDAVWHDSGGSLHPGDLWWRKIVEEVQAREVFIVVLSPDAVQSSYVNLEIDLAWREKHKNWSRLIVPILYRECAIRADLDVLHIVKFLPPKTYEEAFDELLAALQLPAVGQVALTQTVTVTFSDLEALQLPAKRQEEQAGKRQPDEEAHTRADEEEKQQRVQQEHTRPDEKEKIPPGSPRQGISRRRVVIGLAGLTVVGLAGGSFEVFSRVSLFHPTATATATPTYSPPPILKNIYVAWIGTIDQELNIASYASDQSPSLKPIFHGEDTNGTSPALAASSSTLYIAWTGTDRQLNVASYAPNQSPATILPIPLAQYSNDTSPTLTLFNNLFYIAWIGTDQQLNIASYAPGQMKPQLNSNSLTPTSNTTPALAISMSGSRYE